MLVDSRWRISELARQSCGFRATAEGFGPGRMQWTGLAEGKYVLAAKRADKVVWQQDVTVDDSQRLAVTIQADALSPLLLELTCVPAH